MVVTALRYFMPLLLPFVPDGEWEDPMAVRLMTAFDKSGLLAVAKFIHLAAGLLLLANRAVPFALAALMPVNLCGLFIALFIEGDPLVAVLAVLTVALNGAADARLPAELSRRARRRAAGRRRRAGSGAELREPVRQSARATRRPRPISAARWCWPRRWRSTGSWCPASTA